MKHIAHATLGIGVAIFFSLSGAVIYSAMTAPTVAGHSIADTITGIGELAKLLP